VSGFSFDDLVAVAALGVSRKGFVAAELDGPAAGYAGVLDSGDPAAALLDAAALLTVAGRAGVQPQRETAAPPAAVAVTAVGERELSVRGARLLARIGGLDRERGLARGGAELLEDLLIAMRDAGYVLSAPLLPGLLDVASRAQALRPAVASVLGTRGRWLARHRADWQQVADASPATGTRACGASGTRTSAAHGAGTVPVADPLAVPGPFSAPAAAMVASGTAAGTGDGAAVDSDGSGGPEVWRVGRLAERRAFLVSLRGRDPRGGRALLAAGWSRESKEERAGLLAVLASGLSADDEEFLESALGDRAGEVREVARWLLALLPGSAFSRRAAERATGVLRLEGDGPDAWLVAHVPDDLDQAAIRDGIEPRSPVGWVDAAAWRFSQLIAGAPLSGWTARLRMTPAQIVALPVEGVAAIDVRAGWRLAASRPTATRAADPELTDWALALLGADLGVVNRPASVWPPDPALASLLPAGLRAARAAALVAEASINASHPRDYPARVELDGHPVPWPPVLADAVLGALAREVLRPKLTVLSQTIVNTAGRGMPATGAKDYAAELTRLATRMAESWIPEVHAAAETIALRRAFLEELR
jgi:hypothetical protein